MRELHIGNPVIRLQSVDSTNTYAGTLLRKDKVAEGTAILADHQTKGKGHGTNRWFSEPGLNLLFSIILYPDFLPADKQFYLSMSVSNAIVDFIMPIRNDVCIKWPNDILLCKKKVAGLLIENTVMGRNLLTTIIGIGLNINQNIFPDDLPNATSLRIESGKLQDLDNTFESLMSVLNFHLNKLYLKEYVAIKTSYLNSLWLLNNRARYCDQCGAFEGRIVDVNDSGELIVMRREGIKHYGFKELVFPAYK